jgi:catechol 2,3-dioxygenase-like lactoylglutathione lyase family enzyme
VNPSVSVITLGVDDLERAVAFYRDGLGLKTDGIVGTQFEHGAVAFFDLGGGLKLAVWPRASLAHDSGLDVAPRSSTDFSLGHNVPSKPSSPLRSAGSCRRRIQPRSHGRAIEGGRFTVRSTKDGESNDDAAEHTEQMFPIEVDTRVQQFEGTDVVTSKDEATSASYGALPSCSDAGHFPPSGLHGP